MWALLSPGLWRVVAVAATLALLTGAYFTWRSIQREVGRAEVRAEWNADIDQRTAAALAASEAARVKEQTLQAAARKVQNDFNNEKQRRLAADVAAADSLQQLAAALARQPGASGADPAAPAGADDDPRNDIIAECSAALYKVDKAARSLLDQTQALQGYAGSVCVSGG